jgi:hypothetical protein
MMCRKKRDDREEETEEKKKCTLYCMWMKRRENSHNHGIAKPAWNNQV